MWAAQLAGVEPFSRFTAILHNHHRSGCKYAARQGRRPRLTKGTSVHLRATILKGRRSTIVGVTVALVIVVGGAGAWAMNRSSASDATTPTLVAATTSTIRQSVSATGT